MFKVFVDDDFHYMDEDERYLAGEYATLGAAQAKCRSIVENDLAGMHEPGMTPDKLVSAWLLFGEDPWIEGGGFSARDHARVRSVEICGRPELST